jgi:hypothetical protein
LSQDAFAAILYVNSIHQHFEFLTMFHQIHSHFQKNKRELECVI